MAKCLNSTLIWCAWFLQTHTEGTGTLMGWDGIGWNEGHWDGGRAIILFHWGFNFQTHWRRTRQDLLLLLLAHPFAARLRRKVVRTFSAHHTGSHCHIICPSLFWFYLQHGKAIEVKIILISVNVTSVESLTVEVYSVPRLFTNNSRSTSSQHVTMWCGVNLYIGYCRWMFSTRIGMQNRNSPV